MCHQGLIVTRATVIDSLLASPGDGTSPNPISIKQYNNLGAMAA